jgi:hypothetical protein
MLTLKYLKFKFLVDFEKTFFFSKLPTFLLRSLLGSELRRLTCITNKKNCKTCIINKTCVYSYIFETHVDKNNEILNGVDRLSHPFVMYAPGNFGSKNSYFEITLIGEKAIKYFPYIFYAFKNLGEKGILKEKIKYKISKVICNKKNILKNDSIIIPNNYLDYSLEKKLKDSNKKEKLLNLTFKTPVRLKKKGKYISNINYEDFLSLSIRRLNILGKLYGDNKELEDFNFDGFLKKEIIKNKQIWVDFNYFSRRQNKEMKLGGIIGEISFKGVFDDLELKLLEFGEIFNIGKNISFGLGNINLEEN